MTGLNHDEKEMLVRAIVENLPKAEIKTMFKEAIDEWMDKQFSKFGRWSVYGIVASAIGVLGYFIFSHKIR